jgi:hypothetical protein
LEAAFAHATHEGVGRDGSHLFPAFPFDHFTKISDEDTKALYAYLITQPPVRARPPKNTIRFPLNIRAFQQGWKILFFGPSRFEPVQGESDEWNRAPTQAHAIPIGQRRSPNAFCSPGRSTDCRMMHMVALGRSTLCLKLCGASSLTLYVAAAAQLLWPATGA